MPKVWAPPATQRVLTDEEKQQRLKEQQRNARQKYYNKNKQKYNLVNARNRYIRLLNEEMNRSEIVSKLVHEKIIEKYKSKIDEYNERIKNLEKIT